MNLYTKKLVNDQETCDALRWLIAEYANDKISQESAVCKTIQNLRSKLRVILNTKRSAGSEDLNDVLNVSKEVKAIANDLKDLDDSLSKEGDGGKLRDDIKDLRKETDANASLDAHALYGALVNSTYYKQIGKIPSANCNGMSANDCASNVKMEEQNNSPRFG